MAKSRKRENGVIEGRFNGPVDAVTNHSHADHERVAERAYQLFIERGGRHGRDMDDWLAAEREVSGREERTGSER